MIISEFLFREMLTELKRVHPMNAEGLLLGCATCNVIVEAEKALAGYEFESAEVPAHVFEDGDRLCVACGARLPEGATGNSCRRCL